MLPADIKATLNDVQLSTKKITERDIVEFDRRRGKKEVEEIRRLGALLAQAVADDDSDRCDKLTTTISKIVRGK
jgi:hypothetical protein